MTRRVVILGSTGSIGTQALDVCRRHPDRFRVVGLAVASSVDELCRQASEFHPEAVCVRGPSTPARGRLPEGTRLLTGDDGLVRLATEIDCDIVLNAIVGVAGLEVTVAALAAGRDLALANKESLVAGGPVVRRARALGGGRILPVDSEHAASAQLLNGEHLEEVARLVLTASGGPFRGCKRADLEGVTAAEALRHPTWEMGAKITIDSATLFNKGLEVLEAHELFGLDFDRIGVVVHPQSIIHAILEMIDGSSKAHLSLPDMRQPIAWALAWPDRLADPIGAADWTALPEMTFEEPDTDAFAALRLAYAAGRAGGTAPAVLSAANEESVQHFLKGTCRFLDISEVVETVLERHKPYEPSDVADVIEAGDWARQEARAVLAARAS